MKYIIKLLAISAVLITTAQPVLAQAPVEDNNSLTTEQIIEKTALQFNQDPALISKISWCESGHKIKQHDGGRGVNMTGIHDDTFNRWLPIYRKEVGETLSIDSTYDQFKMMSWAFSKGEDYRDDWTTYVAYRNGGEYAFHSRLLKKDFVVLCKK